MLFRCNMLFLSSGSKRKPSKQTSRWQASFQDTIKMKVNLFMRLLGITKWKCMGGVYITPSLSHSALEDDTLQSLPWEPYVVLSACRLQSCSIESCSNIIIKFKFDKINLFLGVIQSYYKQNSVDYVIHKRWIISRMQTSLWTFRADSGSRSWPALWTIFQTSWSRKLDVQTTSWDEAPAWASLSTKTARLQLQDNFLLL